MVRYDEHIIVQFAQRLYDQANLTVLLFTLVGLLAGGGIGSLTPGEFGTLIGAVVLGVIGFMIGQTRAFQLKLHAQMALCQVQIEQNTRSSGAMTKERVSKETEAIIRAVGATSITASARPASGSGRRCRDCGAELPRVAEYCPKCAAPVTGKR